MVEIGTDTRADEDNCCENERGKWMCTCEKGHDGPHACDFAVWGNEDAPTMRDEFAKAALTSVLLAGSNGWSHGGAAKEAYAMADAMLAERDGREQ